jgi:hypothetical protein
MKTTLNFFQLQENRLPVVHLGQDGKADEDTKRAVGAARQKHDLFNVGCLGRSTI